MGSCDCFVLYNRLSENGSESDEEVLFMCETCTTAKFFPDEINEALTEYHVGGHSGRNVFFPMAVRRLERPSFKGKDFLRRSKRITKTSSDNARIALICEEKVTSKKIVKRVKTKKEKKPELSCKFCWKKFEYNSLLERHLRKHTGHRPFECLVCTKSFKEKSHLLDHITMVHCHVIDDNLKSMFKCAFCGDLHQIKEGVRKHVSDFHHELIVANI